MDKSTEPVTESIIQETKSAVETATEQLKAVSKAALEKAQEVVDKAQETVEKVQEEGNRLFESLTKEGEKIREQTRKLAEEAIGTVKGRVEDARSKASDTLETLEQIFEDRVARILNRLGIPTKEDFQALAKRLEELNENVRQLAKHSKPKALVVANPARDDLTEIDGIGPSIQEKLNTAGIFSYRQIAVLADSEIDNIEAVINRGKGYIMQHNWIEQAKQLHLQKYNEVI